MNARTTALFLILLSFFSLFGLWEWHSLVGPSNTKALAISYDTGSKSTAMFAGMDKEMSGNTVGKCAFMMDGDWYNCPVDLAPQNTALTAVHFRDSDNVFIIRYKMMGLPSLLTFNIHNTLSFIIHDFTMDDNLSMYNLEIVGDTFWAGTRDGAVLISNDEGQSWEKFTITSDSDVEISVVHFDDEMHGYAAGGYIEDDPIDGKILHEKGGIWETEDGGKTWDSVVTKLELMPWKVVKGEADGKWWMVADNDQTYAMAGDPIRVHLFSNDDFENYDYHIPTANTGKKFGGSPYAGGEFTRIGNQLWLGGSAMDNSNVTFMSEDEGETWTELFFPQDHGVPIAIFGSDVDHIYSYSAWHGIAKYGEINEKYDDEEVPDEDTATTDESEVNDNDNATITDDDTSEIVSDDDSVEEMDGDIPPVQAEGCGCSLIL